MICSQRVTGSFVLGVFDKLYLAYRDGAHHQQCTGTPTTPGCLYSELLLVCPLPKASSCAIWNNKEACSSLLAACKAKELPFVFNLKT
jgi:hypothetical protein